MIYSVTIELSTDNDTEHDKVTLTDNDIQRDKLALHW
jgi:hypothetical protein